LVIGPILSFARESTALLPLKGESLPNKTEMQAFALKFSSEARESQTPNHFKFKTGVLTQSGKIWRAKNNGGACGAAIVQSIAILSVRREV
jgi:hypothetical protein